MRPVKFLVQCCCVLAANSICLVGLARARVIQKFSRTRQRGLGNTYQETIWLKHRMLVSRLSAYSLEMRLTILSESTKLSMVCSLPETRNSAKPSICNVFIQLSSCNELVKHAQQPQGRTRRTSLFWPDRIINTVTKTPKKQC